jgi:hypothetical protein
VAAGALVLSGCGNVSADEVESVAASFVEADDPAAQCELLAPGTFASLVKDQASSCEEAIQDVPLGSGELVSVEVWGEEAQAKLADDTLFLTRTSAGWRITAAACTPPAQDEPYDCQLEGS